MPALNSIPGEPEVWLVGNQAYLVYIYDFDFIEGEIPVAFSITQADLQSGFGPGKSIVYDKKLTTAAFDKVGALDFGSSVALANFSEDPMTLWMENFETEAKVRPWLLEPEIAALTLGAYLEGRDVTDAEFEQTEWWRTHNEAQRQWLLLTYSDPMTAAQMEADARIQVRTMLSEFGVAAPGADVVQYMANQLVTGNWSASYLETQARKLSDPYAHGKLEKGLADIVKGDRPAGTRDREDDVVSLYRTWLGPRYGNLTNAEIRRHAGKLRNDPDYETILTNRLQKKRLGLFGAYTDPDMTYDDIADLWRDEWMGILGEAPDEVGDAGWLSVIRANDFERAGQMIRQHGINKGSLSVQRSAVRDALGAFGTVNRPI